METLIVEHPGKTAGALIGLVFGWLTIHYGLFKAVFLLACVAGGFYLGSRWERGEGRFWTERLIRRQNSDT
ncbi:Small integral membrane protein [Carboxydocella sporoproducens DSM 16521]|uniref:Small integral membrane protein n=2 Tax=Carboxydocella TaxID=178898 RepID=A0A1T4NWY0_9FIRM|nr:MULTISPECIES: DUF2273 domain-containing protein [Carboxydocella]AVX20147.1 Small integral membrane protein (DUF2273) [Carboxydocella thermautotrophica]AVX30566.1 Small integral membrane protein (DUF2273) [Carboxydocella thermautotrophica]SJZ83567.1 Small integral membrane protein [Carboxydocella sporoproducens DSM 16521]